MSNTHTHTELLLVRQKPSELSSRCSVSFQTFFLSDRPEVTATDEQMKRDLQETFLCFEHRLKHFRSFNNTQNKVELISNI